MVGITARTLRNWNKTPAFQRALALERACAGSARRAGQAPLRARRAAGKANGLGAPAGASGAAHEAAAGRVVGEGEAAVGAPENWEVAERGGAAVGGRGRHPPLELEPFSPDWLAWHAGRRHPSEIDLLNYNDAFRASSRRSAPGSRARALRAQAACPPVADRRG